MRRFVLMFTVVTMSAATAGLRAAELHVPARRAGPEHVSVQKGPPNCAQWTDDCVICTRDVEGEAPLCSNIGVACQPKEMRCVSPAPAAK